MHMQIQACGLARSRRVARGGAHRARQRVRDRPPRRPPEHELGRQGFQSNDCVTTPGPGQVVWHFVLTTPNATSGHLTATFQNAGTKTVANLDSPSTTLHFEIVTGHDTLLDAETTDVDGGNLNLSHICAGTREVHPERPGRDGQRPRRDRHRFRPRPRPLRSRPPPFPPRRPPPGRDATFPPRRPRRTSVPAETASVPVDSRARLAEPGHQPPVPELPAGRKPERQGRCRDRHARRGRHAAGHRYARCPRHRLERRLAAGAGRARRADRHRAHPHPEQPEEPPLGTPRGRDATLDTAQHRKTGVERPRSSAVRADVAGGRPGTSVRGPALPVRNGNRDPRWGWVASGDVV